MGIKKIEPDTFPKLLLHNSKQIGEQPAFREKNRGIWRTQTWREFADDVAALAAAFSARGLKRGAHFALLGDNRPRLYAAMCAAQSLGAVAVPLYQDATAAELTAPVASAEVTHAFAENQEQVDKLLDILPRCPALRCIIYDKDRGMRHYKHSQLVSYDALLQEGRGLASTHEALQVQIAHATGEDPAFVFFTSGATGPAKGVVVTHGALIDRARSAAAMEELTHDEVSVAYLPPGWIGQNVFGYAQPLVAGYCVCCPESSDTMLADMREMGPTYFLATPRVLDTMLTQVLMRLDDTGRVNRALYRHAMAVARRVETKILVGETPSLGDRIAAAAYNVLIYSPLRDMLGLSKVRVAYTAGDAIDPLLLMFFRALGINLKQIYGSTETGFFVAMQRDGGVKPDTVGPIAQGVEIKFGPQREILVRSPGLFKEYHRDPDATSRARSADGWFHTGDAGYLGDDGHLRIVDRVTNVGALKDGTPFAPKLIENKLTFLTMVKDAVAFGDERNSVCVLIDIDMAAVSRWADAQGISYVGHADLASHEEVYGLLAEGIAMVNADLAQGSQSAKSPISRFAILQNELSADDGVLTRTGKLKRGVIAERFRPLIDAMYDGRTEMQVALTDNPAAPPVDVKIRDVKAAAAAPASSKRAA